MNLTDDQKKAVSAWIAEGLKLAEIQTRLNAEFGLTMTYMDTRFLVDDLKLVPKDIEQAKPVHLGQPPAGAAPASPGKELPRAQPGAPIGTAPARPGAGVSVTVDQIARPGAVASGKVTFRDGKTAEWYLDQLGRLGVVPAEQGYKPSAVDMQAFQLELQNELARMGF